MTTDYRMTDEDLERLRSLAADAGVSPSGWLRAHIRACHAELEQRRTLGLVKCRCGDCLECDLRAMRGRTGIRRAIERAKRGDHA